MDPTVIMPQAAEVWETTWIDRGTMDSKVTVHAKI